MPAYYPFEAFGFFDFIFANRPISRSALETSPSASSSRVFSMNRRDWSGSSWELVLGFLEEVICYVLGWQLMTV